MQSNTRDTHDTRNAKNTPRDTLGEQLQRRLQEHLGVHITVATTVDAVFLDGRVSTPEQRERVGRLVTELAPGKHIENNLEVEELLSPTEAEPTRESSEVIDEPNIDDLLEKEALSAEEAPQPDDIDPGKLRLPPDTDELDDPTLLHEIPGDDASLTDQPLETNALNVANDSVYDADDSVEPDPAYFAPTDPVIGSGPNEDPTRAEVVGGFEPTSLDDVSVDPSAEDNRPGDEALADAIRRELREDASTTDLQIHVYVVNGVAHLRGTVPSLEDAENAEAVASEVPGVIEVDEELDVQGL
ncbi:MAG TPA: BON domain-containing protein [Ktedonobacterales bacterium]